MFRDIINFFKEAYTELQKVTWLTRKEVIGSTLVIIVLISIMSLFVTLFDFIFMKMIGFAI